MWIYGYLYQQKHMVLMWIYSYLYIQNTYDTDMDTWLFIISIILEGVSN